MRNNSQIYFDKQIRKIHSSLDKQNLRLQSCMRENENIRRELPAITGDIDLNNIVVNLIPLRQTVMANGNVLPEEQIKELNIDNYDVVLDCIDRTLMARKDPDKSTKLEKCDCKNIGKDRLKLLRYMLEHPRVPICEETIPYVYGDVAGISANALAKTIGHLRKCLWQVPYIITEPDWGESISRTGSVYLLNEKYKYLVIRYQI
ncbi:hypothetical protein ACFL5F_08045 [Planctomycetota bacterium]